MFDENEVTESELWELTKSEDVLERAEAMYTLAGRRKVSGRADQAEGLYQSAIDAFSAEGNDYGVARVSYSYSFMLNDTGRHAEALERVGVAIAGYEAALKDEYLADAIRQRARSYAGLERFDLADADYRRAVSDNITLRKWLFATYVQLEFVEYLGGSGRFAEAAEEGHRAIELAELAEDLGQVIHAHDRTAKAYQELAMHDKEEHHLREAYALAAFVDEDMTTAAACCRLAEVLEGRRKFAESLELASRAESLYRQLGNVKWAAQAELIKLQCMVGLDRHAEAVEYADQVRAAGFGVDERQISGLALIEKARALVALNRVTSAYRTFDEALEVAASRDNGWLDRVVRIAYADLLIFKCEYERAFEMIRHLDVEWWGHELDQRARHLAVLAIARQQIDSDSIIAEGLIADCLSLGSAIGLAVDQARCYVLWAQIRRLQGRVEDSKVLLTHAVGLYLRGGRPDQVEGLAEFMLPEGYFTRESSITSVVPKHFNGPLVRDVITENDFLDDSPMFDEVGGDFIIDQQIILGSVGVADERIVDLRTLSLRPDDAADSSGVESNEGN